MRFIVLIGYLIILSSCQAIDKKNNDISSNPNRSIIVYKTKSNYYDKVPIKLSNDKTNIISYPDPSDLEIGKELKFPIELKDSFYLDRIGISMNTVFTNYSYDDYINLISIPSLNDFMKNIIDFEPFIEIYDFNYLYGDTNLIEKLNFCIINRDFRKAKRIL